MEIRLSGRWPDAGGSEGSEGVADGARSSLLMEAMERRGDSDDQTKKLQQKTSQNHHVVTIPPPYRLKLPITAKKRIQGKRLVENCQSPDKDQEQTR